MYWAPITHVSIDWGETEFEHFGIKVCSVMHFFRIHRKVLVNKLGWKCHTRDLRRTGQQKKLWLGTD